MKEGGEKDLENLDLFIECNVKLSCSMPLWCVYFINRLRLHG